MIADSTRHSASRRCSGSASTSSSWPEASTRAIASRESAPVAARRRPSIAASVPARRCWAGCSSELDRSIGQSHAREDTRPAGDRVVRPHRHALAEHRAAFDLGARADAAAGRDDAVAQRAARADLAPRRGSPSARPSSRRRRARSRPAPPGCPRARPGRRARRARSPPGGPPARGSRRPSATASQSLAEPRAHGGVDVALDDVERPLQVALGRADVQPVGVRRETRTDRRRSSSGHTSRSIETLRSGADELEDLALEHVRARADQVRVDRSELGFSTKSLTERSSFRCTSP